MPQRTEKRSVGSEELKISSAVGLAGLGGKKIGLEGSFSSFTFLRLNVIENKTETPNLRFGGQKRGPIMPLRMERKERLFYIQNNWFS